MCILVADDEPMIVSAVQQILTRRGHTVMTAADAAGAIALLDSHRFDAALVDVRMPGSGVTVIAHLQSDPAFDGLVVLMSGAIVADPLVQVGPDVIRLQKPFRLMELVPLLEGAIRH
jgi:CheY-like chemotaxis protein